MSRMSTSTRIVCLSLTEHHSGAFSCHEDVDLNRDCALQLHRTPLWCLLLQSERRPQQGLCTSTSQNTTLVHFLVMTKSTSTGIAHLNFTEHHSGAFADNPWPLFSECYTLFCLKLLFLTNVSQLSLIFMLGKRILTHVSHNSLFSVPGKTFFCLGVLFLTNVSHFS